MSAASISIILWIVIILGWIIFNLYNKNKKLEEAVLKQSFFINGIYSTQSELESIVNKIDTTIWVQSDPEFIATISKIKEIQSSLKEFSKVNK